MNAVDTNVLIYACDECHAAKQQLALTLIAATPDLVMPWQVWSSKEDRLDGCTRAIA